MECSASGSQVKTATAKGKMEWTPRDSGSQIPKANRVLAAGVLFVFVVVGSLISINTADANSLKASSRTTNKQTVKSTGHALLQKYGKLPIRFEANEGQAPPAAKFVSRGQGYTLLLTRSGITLAFEAGKKRSAPKSIALEGLLNDNMTAVAPLLAPYFLFSELVASGDAPHLASTTASNARRVEAQHLTVMRLELLDANPRARATGLNELPGRSNYLIGNNPSKWLTRVPNYASVRFQDVYSGIDLVYHGNPAKTGQLEYDFIVAPGGDPSLIKLNLQGAKHLRLDSHGNLVISVAGGEVLLQKPLVYQQVRNSSKKDITPQKHFLPGRYQITANGLISFKVALYDTRKPLVIDPVLSYSTYLGGTNFDAGTRIAVDSSGDAYVAGVTSSSDFPNTAGIIGQAVGTQTCSWGGKTIPCPDAFVTKLSSDGQTILYSTFIGGSRADGATGIDVDSNGNVFLTGFTSSSDFPTTSGAFQTAHKGQSDVFVSKLNSAGSAFLYSTLLGGSKDDVPLGIATDTTGNAFVAGVTFSTDFPVTQGSLQPTLTAGNCSQTSGYQSPCPDAFVTELNNSGTAIAYSTYLGGSSFDAAANIALDSAGSAYVTGITASGDFPTTSGSYQSTTSGGTCGPSKSTHPCTQGFVAKLNPSGSTLDYSTYFGESDGDTMGTAIAVDGSGNAYVAGITNSGSLQTTGQSFTVGTCGSTTNAFNCPDAFVAKFNSAGSALSYMTYLGGASYDLATDIRLGPSDDAYVVGGTTSLDFPVTNSAAQVNFGGGSCTTDINSTSYTVNCPNAFLTVLGATGSNLYSTFLGGAGGGAAFGVAVDTSGNAYLAGTTVSSDFPVANAEQPQLAGDSEAFVAKISGISASTAAVALSPGTLTFGDVNVGDSSTPQTATLSNSGNSALSISSIGVTGTNSSDFSQTNTCGTSLAAGSSCTISIVFNPGASGWRNGTLTVTDGAGNSPQTASLTGRGQDFTLTANTSSQTVTAGAAASYDLQLSPQGGFNQAVDLSCSGGPAHSTCTVDPFAVTLDGSNSASAKVTVSTTSASMFGPTGPGHLEPPSGSLPLAAWLGLLSLMGLIVLARFTPEGSRCKRLAPFATLALLVTLWVACGGGSSTAPAPTSSGTPAGTSTLTVTGTAGSLSHSVQVTLTVQ